MKGVAQGLVVLVLHHEGGQLRVEFTEQGDVAVAHLVEHGDGGAGAVGGSLGGLDGGDVGDVAVVADGVVVDEVAHLLDEAVVTHADVAQRGIVDAGVLHEALAHLYLLLEGAQLYVAVEDDPMEVVGTEVLCHLHPRPVFGPAAVGFEHVNFFAVQ